MSFCNSIITPVNRNKPHIVFIDKYWRVSKIQKGFVNNKMMLDRWRKAHDFVQKKNDELNYPWGRDV